MQTIMSDLFTKESAKRHLIQLGITALLAVWSYVAMALLTGNWNMFSLSADPLGDKQGMVNATGIMFMLFFGAVFGILTYWNAKKWMLPCLMKSGLFLLGAIPIVNMLVPKEMVSSWWEKIDELNTSDGTITTYYDRYGKIYSTDGSMPLIFAIPIGIVLALLKGVALSALNLIAAIGIPVLAPLAWMLGALATQLLTDWSYTAALIIAIVCFLAVLAVFVVQPIIAFKKDRVEV